MGAALRRGDSIKLGLKSPDLEIRSASPPSKGLFIHSGELEKVMERSYDNASFNVGAALLRGDLLVKSGRRSEIGSHTHPPRPPYSNVMVT